MMTDSGTIYSTYNARMLSPEEIARTFVINENFRKLLKNDHSVLRGPRGAGKTTLLKMLTAPALREWKEREKYGIPLRLAFSAIYVPSDVIWSQQIEQLKEVPTVGEVLSKAAVTCNVLHAVVAAFADIISTYFPKADSPEINGKLCIALGDAIRVKPFPSLAGLQRELEKRLRDISNFAVRARSRSLTSELPQYCYDDYFTQVRLFFSIFEDLVTEGEAQRWALCFDELEIAPDWLIDDLIRKLRSSDQRILLKISISPTYRIGLASQMANPPSPRNDYTDIPLWYPTQQEAKKFCDDLMRRYLETHFNTPVEPRDLFGLSPFIEENSYDRNSAFWAMLRRESRHDRSLRNLLAEKSIKFETKEPPTIDDRDQVLRKLKPILVLRRAFWDPRRGTVRSRKRPGVYHGYDAIATISDGNPRWLVGLLNDLLLTATEPSRLPSERQEAILTEAGTRFNALINSLPQLVAVIGGRSLRIKDMLRRIATFFFRRIVTDEISLDPATCFIVDSRTPDDVIKLLEKAVDMGAAVIVSEESTGDVPRSLRGAKLRLSFMLATVYRQPLRVFGAIALSHCLRETNNGDIQIPLFERKSE